MCCLGQWSNQGKQPSFIATLTSRHTRAGHISYYFTAGGSMHRGQWGPWMKLNNFSLTKIILMLRKIKQSLHAFLNAFFYEKTLLKRPRCDKTKLPLK